jgi:hypothetical protein
MSDADWQLDSRSRGVFLNDAIPTPNERGERVVDDSFYIMFNAHQEALQFRVPPKAWGAQWTQVLDTYESADEMSEERLGRKVSAGGAVQVRAWSLVLCGGLGTCRAIMTSVDLITASASSPRRSFSSSTASRVMIAVSL